MVCRLSAGAEWIRTFSSAPDGQQFVVSSELGPMDRRTVIQAVAGLGEPLEFRAAVRGVAPHRLDQAGVTPRSRCRRCEPIAEPKVRIRSPPPERCYGAGGEDGNFVAYIDRWSAAMPQPNDLSRSLEALDQDSTIIAVVEMSQSSWLVGGVLPGIERQPRKKLEPNPERLLALLHSHPSCGAERR